MLSRKKKNIGGQGPFPAEPPLCPPALGNVRGKCKNTKDGYESPAGQLLEKARLLATNGDFASSSKLRIGGTEPYIKKEGVNQRQNVVPVGPTKDSVVNGIIPKLGDIISTENAAERTRELKRLIYCLNDWENINDDTLMKLIESLKTKLDVLDEKMNPLVEQIVQGKWTSRPSKIVRSIESFIAELMVVRPGFAGHAMHSMISRFIPSPQIDINKPDEILAGDQKVFSVAHRNLKRIVESFPMISCTKTMEAMYPYMTKGPYVHFCFVFNLIKAMDYMPQSKYQILQLIIHKLCRVDVNIPRDDVEEFNEVSQRETILSKIKAEGGGHVDISMDFDAYNSGNEVNPLLYVLDLCLGQLFEHCDSDLLIYNDTGVRSLDNIFENLCSTFEKELLTAFSANHVQFLFFYLLSQNTTNASKFLEFLWTKATCTFSPMVVRIQAMANISGLLARGAFIPIKTVKRWLTRMADWANAYVDINVKNCHWSTVNIQAHFPFYAVCQAIFYVFAFRNKELIGSRKCVAYTRTLNLGRLVTSDLNPLKACVEMVAETFVNAAHHHQISYCKTVLERNERATIPIILAESLDDLGEEAAAVAMNSMECFFPYDPFLLPKSRKWIDPIFRIYDPYLPELKIEKQEISRENIQDEDSIEMELSVSFKDSTFLANGMVNTSDIKDEDSMDDYID